jgi:hypothetical protein
MPHGCARVRRTGAVRPNRSLTPLRSGRLSYSLQICTTDPESTTETAGGSVFVTGGPFGSNLQVIVEPGCGTRPRSESVLAALP